MRKTTTGRRGSTLHCPPRFGTRRTPGRPTLGAAVGRVAAMLGTPLMPWQQYVADVALEIDPDIGKLAYDEVTLVVGRQQGKSSLVLPVLAHRARAFARTGPAGDAPTLWVPPGVPQRIVYAAHTGDKSREKWRDTYVTALQASPLASLIADVRLRLNMERLLFDNESSFVPVTPSASTGGTGDTIDQAHIDEAWSHEGSGLEQAMSPAMVSRDQSQLWIESTRKRQPDNAPRKPHFEAYLKAKITAGRARVDAGVTRGSAFFEWSTTENADPEDPATWWGCLPAMGYTVAESGVRTQLNRMKLADFCCEFLGIPEDGAAQLWKVVPEYTWAQLADRTLHPGYPIAFAVDVAPDRGMAALCSAGPCGSLFTGPDVPRDDLWAVEVVEHRAGTAWLVDRVVEVAERWRPCAVVVSRAGMASSMIEPLRQAFQDNGMDPDTVKVVGQPEMAKAYSVFHDAVMPADGPATLRHAEQPELDAALSVATRRRLESRWLWDWQSPGDISPVQAATLALWGAQTFGPTQRELDYDVLESVF